MANQRNSQFNRRGFLNSMVTSISSTAVIGSFSSLTDRLRAEEPTRVEGFGPLREAIDESTGLPLIQLPDGFRYCSYGWTNEPLSNGAPTPGAHDGMAVIQETGDKILLCRNHEIGSQREQAIEDGNPYDAFGGGGCSTVEFDRKLGRFTGANVALSGTVKNCAGGAAPWGAWLSCEETVVDPDTKLEGNQPNRLEKPHGFVFEVPSDRTADARPIESLGRFVHEALAIDPETGIVYLTEDRGEAGLYRMIPKDPNDLHAGGRFQMLACQKLSDSRKGIDVGRKFDTLWVDIEDRLRAHSPGTQDAAGVFSQGKASGGLSFARLEGCAFFGRKLFVTATSGGNAEAGQVWEYSPDDETLSLIFESPGETVLDMPDNMAVSPRGGILLCEDGHYVPQRIQMLTDSGKLFPLAANNIQLTGLHGHRGDFRDSEWAGATFSADGQWLFINIQTPGVTLAITGPWDAIT